MDKDTKICISIAEKPGTFGLEFHNLGYEELELNYDYIPLKVLPEQLEATMQLTRDNFHACSVSMPHKVNVIDYLNKLESSAEKCGAVNTILNKNRILIGYNTDYFGAKRAIEEVGNIHGKKVLMIGAGGVARAIGHAVKDLGGDLVIANRTLKKAKSLAEELDSNAVNWEQKNQEGAYLLINATRVGMDNPEERLVSEQLISRFEAVMDVVVKPTRLIREAEKQGKVTIPGLTMTTYQAAKQFEIYTGKQVPKNVIEKVLGK